MYIHVLMHMLYAYHTYIAGIHETITMDDIYIIFIMCQVFSKALLTHLFFIKDL